MLYADERTATIEVQGEHDVIDNEFANLVLTLILHRSMTIEEIVEAVRTASMFYVDTALIPQIDKEG